jgi:phage-related protein
MAAAAVRLIVAFINAIGSSTVKVVNAAIQMVISMINGIANSIRSHTPQLESAMRNLGSAIIGAMAAAITGGAKAVISAITGVVSGAISWAKHLLGINSPSRVFMDMFKSVPEGAALGVTNNAGMVVDAMGVMTNAAIQTVGKSMAAISKSVADVVDIQPKITPVVDLTQLKGGLSTMSSLIGDQQVKANVSATSAASISAANAAAASKAGLLAGGGTQLIFQQTNNSPVALDAITIYRQTKNQLSIARGALTGAN